MCSGPDSWTVVYMSMTTRWLSAHLGATADQSHGPDGVGPLSGVRVLQAKHRLVDGVWTQVDLPVHREVLQQRVHSHQAVRHASKHPAQTLEVSERETARRQGIKYWGLFGTHSLMFLFNRHQSMTKAASHSTATTAGTQTQNLASATTVHNQTPASQLRKSYNCEICRNPTIPQVHMPNTWTLHTCFISRSNQSAQFHGEHRKAPPIIQY